MPSCICSGLTPGQRVEEGSHHAEPCELYINPQDRCQKWEPDNGAGPTGRCNLTQGHGSKHRRWLSGSRAYAYWQDTAQEQLAAHRAEAEAKAIDSLGRYKFAMFGYWAGIWVHLNHIIGDKRPSPFKHLVEAAKKGAVNANP